MGRERGARSGIVASLAATTTAGYGILFYAFGVLLVPMQRDLGWSASTLSGAFSSALLVAAVATIPVGRWLDHHDPRPLLLGGAIGATALVALWARVTVPVLLYAVWIPIGGCMAVLFYEPAFTVVTKWFAGDARRKGLTAITLAAGLASTVFGPLTDALERALGWRGAVTALAALLGVVTIPVFMRLRPPESAQVDDVDTESTVPRDALRSGQFWVLTTAYLLSAITTFAVAVHVVPYLIQRGWRSGAAAAVLGSIGFVQVVGRSTFVRLSARRSARQLGPWVLGAKAVGLASLLLAPNLWGVVVFVAVYGAANGIQTLTRATVVADMYGADHYGAISAVVSAVSAVGGAAAPFAVAAAVEAVGAEDPVMWGLVAVAAASAALAAMLREPVLAEHRSI